jgi:GNAT superfamily N-acetyltransferase
MQLRQLEPRDRLWLERLLADRHAIGMLAGTQDMPAGHSAKLAAAILSHRGVAAVTSGDESEPVGCAWLNANALAFIVAPGWRGRGLGVVLAAAMVREGFEMRRLSVIEARARYDNAPSLAVLRRLGFVRTGGSAILAFTLTPARFVWTGVERFS